MSPEYLTYVILGGASFNHENSTTEYKLFGIADNMVMWLLNSRFIGSMHFSTQVVPTLLMAGTDTQWFYWL